ncbi:MAG: ribosome recycling factor [Candidatus Spechtbacterales bacterium]
MEATQLKHKLDKALEVLATSLRQLRVGRASGELVDGIRVDAYGSMMPINQVASVQTPQHDQILIQPWDGGLTGAIAKAIQASDLNLNPSVDGTTIRITLPPLTEERRHELVKIVAADAEEARIAVRNIREEAMDDLDKEEKAKTISEDEKFRKRDQFQKLVDEYNKKIKDMAEQKEEDILKG